MSRPRGDREGVALLHLAAIVLLGQTIISGQQGFSPVALGCASAAIVLVAGGFILPTSGLRALNDYGGGIVRRGMVGLGIFLGFARLPLLGLFVHVPAARPILLPLALCCGMGLLCAALLLIERPVRVLPVCFPLLLVSISLMGGWYLSRSRNPQVDVYLIQRLGCQALLSGHDPFAMTFPDPYPAAAPFYPPGSVINGQVQCGYFYPPLSLLLDVPAYLLGDVRYAGLASLIIAAALIGYLRLGLADQKRGRDTALRARPGIAPAMLLLFTPGIVRILVNAWIEPLLLLMLAAAVFATVRRGAGVIAAALLGLLLSGKQYALLALPAAALLFPNRSSGRMKWRWMASAVGAGLAVTLPFYLWNPAAFMHSSTALYVGILRTDSISFLPLLSHALGRRLPLGATALAAIAPAALVVWRAPRTAAGFAAGAALIWLCVFIFSTQSFGNYYFLAVGALCAAVGCAGEPQPPTR